MKEKAITSIRYLLYIPASILCGTVANLIFIFTITIIVNFIHKIVPISFNAESVIEVICYLCVPFIYNKYAFWSAVAVAPRKSVWEAYIWLGFTLIASIFGIISEEKLNIPAMLSCFQLLFYGYGFVLACEEEE